MKKVLITGGNGLVGSRVINLLKDKYEFTSLSRTEGVDITDSVQVSGFIKNLQPEIILHMAAKADVDGCEQDKASDLERIKNNEAFDGLNSAYAVNTIGARNVAICANELGKKIIYISTDFVFDGEKEDAYVEEDLPNPINWYAKTKYDGEKEIEKAGGEYIIARIAYPYRKDFPKKDFVRAIISRLENGQGVIAVTDHIMTPTFIDDIAYALDKLIDSNSQGIFHIVGSSSSSPYEISLKIAEIFGFDKSLIAKTTRQEFFGNRAPRPFHLALKNDKIARLGIGMRPIEEGLQDLKDNS